MRRPQRSTVVALVLVVGIVGVLVWLTRPVGEGVPLDPRGSGPRGTAAMVRLLEQVGADVSVSDTPPADGDGDVIVVLADRLDDARRDDVRRRVEAGARLVLFAPTSPMSPVEATGVFATDLLGVVGQEPSCDVLDGVADRVEAARWVVLDPLPATTDRCFPLEDGFGLLAHPVGGGEVVVTGAVDALVNRSIDEADHARLAVALLAPDGDEQVTFLWDTAVGGGEQALLDLLPLGVERAFWVLVLGVVLYAWVRARRLGMPVTEQVPVRVPASELALSIGDLLGRHGHRDAAAARLRADLRSEVAAALHVPQDTPPEVLVELLVERHEQRGGAGSLDSAGVRTALLDGPVPDDDALVAVTAALARVRSLVRARGSAGAGASHR